MTEKTDPTSMSGTSVSRRKLLLGGAVVTGAVWAAPAIESVTSVAAASTSTPTDVQAFSYVTILLAAPPSAGAMDYYRLKFDLVTVSAAPGTKVSASASPARTPPRVTPRSTPLTRVRSTTYCRRVPLSALCTK